ncbi:hypothetical protein LCGC14_2965110 [marine sediment metagenome]|uniref:Uncharacterized protein n=1 Tax=marine sediment metagenome TaxID=412755 RepID=A0A0F8XB09_9ZZZZ
MRPLIKFNKVLEHLIFELREKKIGYEIKEVGKENGFSEQIILKIKENDLFVYIKRMKKLSRIIWLKKVKNAKMFQN